MAVLMPIPCIRPQPEQASRIATGPHSAMSRRELQAKVRSNPYSYSRIVHPKALLGDVRDAFAKSAGFLREWIEKGIMVDDTEPCFYLYTLEADGHVQTGIVGRTPIEEVAKCRVHAHENVRESKLKDLADHIDECGAQIGGPILMAYRSTPLIREMTGRLQQSRPLYHFRSENGVLNRIWRISDEADNRELAEHMRESGDLYIADGHHRVMAAVELWHRYRKKHPESTGTEDWNYLSCVCFPSDELKILSYTRLITVGTEHHVAGILDRARKNFEIVRCSRSTEPSGRGEFVLCTQKAHYLLTFREKLRPKDESRRLDVSVLQEFFLDPVFGIENPGQDSRLEFIGGIHQKKLAEERCRRRGVFAVLLYPTSMEELFAVADRGEIMPPKSTWFEPKLCNGLFIYRLRQSIGFDSV